MTLLNTGPDMGGVRPEFLVVSPKEDINPGVLLGVFEDILLRCDGIHGPVASGVGLVSPLPTGDGCILVSLVHGLAAFSSQSFLMARVTVVTWVPLQPQEMVMMILFLC